MKISVIFHWTLCYQTNELTAPKHPFSFSPSIAIKIRPSLVLSPNPSVLALDCFYSKLPRPKDSSSTDFNFFKYYYNSPFNSSCHFSREHRIRLFETHSTQDYGFLILHKALCLSESQWLLSAHFYFLKLLADLWQFSPLSPWHLGCSDFTLSGFSFYFSSHSNSPLQAPLLLQGL